MAIPLPNLDNRSYTDLVEQARTLIPKYYPAWTDHNPSDPGIVFIELLAWLTEMVLYRTNQLPDANYLTFLQLLNEPGWTLPGELTRATLDAAVRDTILHLRQRYRAATREDFEYLLLNQWPQTPQDKELFGSAGVLKRVRCLPQRNLELTGSARTALADGHVSVVVVPNVRGNTPQPTDALRVALWRFLDARRLLTTRHHVVGPDYLQVRISATLYLEEDAPPATIRTRAVDALQAFFHPLTGGLDRQGWPFGRDVQVSEVYEVLDKVPGVNFCRAVRLAAPGHSEREQSASGAQGPMSITLDPHELVAVDVTANNFTTLEHVGDTWQPTA